MQILLSTVKLNTADKIEKALTGIDPSWKELKKVGSPVKKAKIELPYFMPSLDKVYPEGVTAKFNTWNGAVVVMPKLDGASVMAVYEKGKLTALYTRGNGIIGQNISHLIPFVSLPTKIKGSGSLALRCEAIMQKKVFQRTFVGKFSNPRNLVNGLLNRKADDVNISQIGLIDFVVIGVYGQTMSDGLIFARNAGFDTVPYEKNKVSASYLKNELRKVKEDFIYEADGLVISKDVEFFYENTDKPKWAIAYKENAEDVAQETKVIDVIWQESRFGILSPKVEVVPIDIDGVTVKYAGLKGSVSFMFSLSEAWQGKLK
jgi:DNA ligase (NAD+)